MIRTLLKKIVDGLTNRAAYLQVLGKGSKSKAKPVGLKPMSLLLRKEILRVPVM